MATKFYIFLIFTVFNFEQIESRCVNILNKEETHCATPLNLDETSVLEFYQTDSEDPKFGEYLNCVWLKWNYVDKDGVILYSNLIKSDNLPWQISRICVDTFQYIDQTRIGFEEAVKYCKQNGPVVESPFTVRRCIHNNYKATPVS